VGLANQSVTPGRTTLLEAVNVLLANIGEAPVGTLEDEQNAEAGVAERTILELHKEGQTRGWSWNIEEGYRFVRDVSTDEIVVPANVVSFSVDRFQWAGRFQLRGQRVYDKENRTYELVDIPYLEADVILLLSWNECPEAYNRWVVARSSRVFSERVLASDVVSQSTAEQEGRAWAELLRVENDQQQPNVLTAGPGLRPFPTFTPGYGVAVGRRTSIFRG
jgi:hypothetical protein